MDVDPPWMKTVLLATTTVCPYVPCGGGAAVEFAAGAADTREEQATRVAIVKRMDFIEGVRAV